MDAAAKTVADAGGLDALINNAAITDGLDIPVQETDMTAMSAVVETNLLGPMRVTLALWPLLEASAAPVVVLVSSSLGSLAIASDPERMESGYAPAAYPASKAALNMLTIKIAHALPRARVNAVNPGLTATNLNVHIAEGHSVEIGAEAIVRAALLGPDDITLDSSRPTATCPGDRRQCCSAAGSPTPRYTVTPFFRGRDARRARSPLRRAARR